MAAADAALRGAGATFPAPLYTDWAAAYARATGVSVTFEAVGSGAGIEQLARREVDFAASDIPLAPQALRTLRAMQFPVVVGGVVPVLNVDGIASAACVSTARPSPTSTSARSANGTTRRWPR